VARVTIQLSLSFFLLDSKMDANSTTNTNSKRDVKKGLNVDDSRRRREETTIKLRKEKKEEGLAKRRNITATTSSSACYEEQQQQSLDSFNAADPNVAAMPPVPLVADAATLSRLRDELLQTTDAATQLVALRSFRRLLSSERNPPVQAVLDLQLLPHFVQCLHRTDQPALQFEAAWALTNVASTDRTRCVVEAGALPPLIALLGSAASSADIREQSAWCLGNIAGDGPELRDLVLRQGAMQPLLANLAQPETLNLLRNCTWTLSNFCRGKPLPALELVLPAMPVLAHLVRSKVDTDTMIDAAWALSYLTDGDEDSRIAPVVALDVLPALVDMLSSSAVAGVSTATTLVVPALRAIGNIVSGNDQQTQAVLDAGALPALSPLLLHAKKNVRKETCWVLSNIAAGTPAQLDALFRVSDLLPRVLQQLASGEWEVRKEASWVISNIATAAATQPEHLLHLLDLQALHQLSELLSVSDVKVVLLALDAIEAFLKLGESRGISEQVLRQLDEAEGIDRLEALQEHQHQRVYNRALELLSTYFGDVEEDGVENIAPANDGLNYCFGSTNQKSNPVNKQTGFVSNLNVAPATNSHFHF
jgi:importin subunit alpha-6/7